MSELDEIQLELERLAQDIPQFIRTGVPENIKSDNVRALELRTNDVLLRLHRLLRGTIENKSADLVGFWNPNIIPPTADYMAGSTYQLLDEHTKAVLSFWVYTGVDEIGWWKFETYQIPEHIYGTETDPNNSPTINAEEKVVGDMYIETTTGTAEGDRLSVWMYIGVISGSLWVKIESKEAQLSDDYVSYSRQVSSPFQQSNARANIGVTASVYPQCWLNYNNKDYTSQEFALDFVPTQFLFVVVNNNIILHHQTDDFSYTTEPTPKLTINYPLTDGDNIFAVYYHNHDTNEQ